MFESAGSGAPLRLTRSPRLDNALRLGWGPFLRTLEAAGATVAAQWLAARFEDADLEPAAETLFAAALADDVEDVVDALFALGELAEETEDDLLADTLWEGALNRSTEFGDGDMIAEATRRLAGLAERLGDPLAAAEFHIGFLNWRREDDHSSDPEDVEIAFDEIVRLAGLDGAQTAAATFTFRQVEFTRLLDADDARAIEGDWEPDHPPYEGWS